MQFLLYKFLLIQIIESKWYLLFHFSFIISTHTSKTVWPIHIIIYVVILIVTSAYIGRYCLFFLRKSQSNGNRLIAISTSLPKLAFFVYHSIRCPRPNAVHTDYFGVLPKTLEDIGCYCFGCMERQFWRHRNSLFQINDDLKACLHTIKNFQKWKDTRNTRHNDISVYP